MASPSRIVLEGAATNLEAPPLLGAVALLVEPEEQMAKSSAALRREVAGTGVAYREIFGQGRQESRQGGELDLTLRQLCRRFSVLSSDQKTRIRALPLERLEELEA